MNRGAVIVLAGCLSPSRLRTLLRHHTADDAFERLRSGRRLHPMFHRGLTDEQVARCRRRVREASAGEAAERCEQLGVDVVLLGTSSYPSALSHDPEAPAVLFARGRLEALDARRVGIVGTRHASASGRATARELGAQLSHAGVAVVSGLALGIDAAAHHGVRQGGGSGAAVAVVGSGHDVCYPARNAELWSWVVRDGVLLSEWPPGTAPEPWRFPLRNRIIAGLSEVLVVVESRESGGSLITARAAADRGIDVMAVPGSPRARASVGANLLIRDGAAPVTSVDDVLTALSLDHRRAPGRTTDARPHPDERCGVVLAVCDEQPSNLDMIVAATGWAVTDAALAVARLERDGWLTEAGGWFEPVGSRLCDS